ncbi:MAG: hypothetical protein AAF657_14695 [Acidobacteriota bacterium]
MFIDDYPLNLAQRSPWPCRRGGWMCWISLTLVWLLPPSVAAQPALQFAPQTVEVSGLTPGGEAVLFGVVRQSVPWMERVVPYVMWLSAEDPDGTASFSAVDELGPKSVWAVVDLTSMASRVDGPNVDAFAVGPLAGADTFSSASSELHLSGSRLQVLVTRAGQGAWSGVVVDGAASDLDGLDNGAVSLSISDLQPVAASGKPPESLQPGDVVVAVDTATLKISSETIAE